MLNVNMKTTVGLLVSNIIILLVGLGLSPPADVALLLPVVVPFILLYAMLSFFCLKGKKWSYAASLILSIIAVVVFFVVATVPNGAGDQGPPAAFAALVMILPVLLAVKSYESLYSLSKQSTA